ncbi:hypothetical protein TNCV_4702601 [Trichonephila clavipes]|nr:hypothetical protein TNCV_4702601 [Trichonephila clavipes]
MGKPADLSDFDRAEIVMPRTLETTISKTWRLVGCSPAVVVSTYRKLCMGGEMTNRWPVIYQASRKDSKG